MGRVSPGESATANIGCDSSRNMKNTRIRPQPQILLPSTKPRIYSRCGLSLTYFLGGVIFLSVTILPIPVVDGLQCYECLSLSCPSLAVCESIKRTMLEVFVPKGHIIHFNPLDPCPEGENPVNSTKWGDLSRECQRSDSVCIVSPIEIISIIDGAKRGKRLESESSLTTTGYLRGCASRRKLSENEDTIRVHVNLLVGSSAGSSRNRSSSTTDSSGQGQGHGHFGQPSQDLEMELDLSKLKFDDGYEIQRVHSHDFYLDQGTTNATKCYEDGCNTKVRMRSGGVSFRDGCGPGGILMVGLVLLVNIFMVRVILDG